MRSADNYRRWIVEGIAPYHGKKVAEVGAGIGSITRVPLERVVAHAGFEVVESRYFDIAGILP